MQEESHLYRFVLILFAFIGFVFVFAYNIYVGNGIDHALLQASLAAFFSFMPLKCFIYCIEKARTKPGLKDLNSESDTSGSTK